MVVFLWPLVVFAVNFVDSIDPIQHFLYFLSKLSSLGTGKVQFQLHFHSVILLDNIVYQVQTP